MNDRLVNMRVKTVADECGEIKTMRKFDETTGFVSQLLIDIWNRTY